MRLLTAKQVAEILQVALPRVYELARLGSLPCIRIGRQIRFPESKLMEWIEQGGSALQTCEALESAL
jgi:excisionase family DNA binding protein